VSAPENRPGRGAGRRGIHGDPQGSRLFGQQDMTGTPADQASAQSRIGCGGMGTNAAGLGTGRMAATRQGASALPGGLGCAAMITGTALRHTRIGDPVLF
jgi:hypothetical protein